jgi:MFS family permease
MPAAGDRSTANLWTLGATQIIGYGTLYYSFGVLAADIARDIGWSLENVFAAFSAALLAGGVVASTAGRFFDRFGAARVMAAGSAVAALALAACALAPSPAFLVVALVLMEIAATVVLYEAAFAFIVQSEGPDASRRIMHLTLIAGFASTIFWPIAAWLNQHLDWREVYLLFAAVNLLVCLPLHLFLARQPHVVRFVVSPPELGPDLGRDGTIAPIHRGKAMILATIAFSLGGFVLSGLLVHMVPLLASVGLGTAAVTVAALFGPSQVLIRFAFMGVVGGSNPVLGAAASSALVATGILVLTASAPLFSGALIFASPRRVRVRTHQHLPRDGAASPLRQHRLRDAPRSNDGGPPRPCSPGAVRARPADNSARRRHSAGDHGRGRSGFGAAFLGLAYLDAPARRALTPPGPEP